VHGGKQWLVAVDDESAAIVDAIVAKLRRTLADVVEGELTPEDHAEIALALAS
jgi:hypothetical protein